MKIYNIYHKSDKYLDNGVHMSGKTKEEAVKKMESVTKKIGCWVAYTKEETEAIWNAR